MQRLLVRQSLESEGMSVLEAMRPSTSSQKLILDQVSI